MQRRLEQLRAVELQPVDRRRHEQVEVAREEEARQRGDDVRQQQDREEAQEHQAEQLAGEQRPDLLRRRGSRCSSRYSTPKMNAQKQRARQ